MSCFAQRILHIMPPAKTIKDKIMKAGLDESNLIAMAVFDFILVFSTKKRTLFFRQNVGTFKVTDVELSENRK